MRSEAQQQRRQRVVEYTRQGKSVVEIAALTGITERSVTRIRTEMGIARPRTWTPMSDAEIQRAAELFADGCSRQEVARTLGRTSDTIGKHFPGQMWMPGEGARFAAFERWAFKEAEKRYA